MWRILVPVLGKIISKVTGIAPKKVGEAEKLVEQALEQDPELQQQVGLAAEELLRYSGEFVQLPKAVQILRASVRPVITYLFVVAYVAMALAGMLEKLLDFKEVFTLFGSNLGLLLGWWFAERSFLKRIQK